MGYIENPKTRGSGILACIPQTGECPNHCPDCFFQSGRSFLEPLDENLPNMPDHEEAINRVVRINDGNDSNVKIALVIRSTDHYPMRFFNTAINKNLEKFKDPVVLTLNPADKTDNDFHKVDPIPNNLMFVRIRVNMWNLAEVVLPAIEYYTEKKVPVVLTFMAYYDTPVPEDYQHFYIFKKRTLNEYWVIKTEIWKKVMEMFWDNPYVYSCSKIEGEKASRACARCGNCIREYFVTMERIRNGTEERM